MLRVYYLCLLFGFHGIYAHHGELERENLMESVRESLGDRARGQRSARAVRTAAGRARRRRQPQSPAAMARPGAAALALVGYVGVAFSVNASARALERALARAADDISQTFVAKLPR